MTAPYILYVGIESLQKLICSDDRSLAPPQKEQLLMLKKGVLGDAWASWNMRIT